jgi:hypothetical protein
MKAKYIFKMIEQLKLKAKYGTILILRMLKPLKM